MNAMPLVAFTLVPFLSLVANNPNQPLDLGRLALAWCVVVVPLVTLLLIVRIANGSIPSRLVVVLSLSIYVLTSVAVSVDNELRLNPILGVASLHWITAALLIAAILVSRWQRVHTYVAALAVLAVAVPAVSLVTRGITPLDVGSAGVPTFAVELQREPNIYWFVLDGYGQSQNLKTSGDDAQDQFVHSLETRGFRLSPEARSNYPLSVLSIATTSSADYIIRPADTPVDYSLLYRRIQGDNAVVSTLKASGYRYVHVPGDQWDASRCSGFEDLCVGGSLLGEAEWTLLRMTPFRDLFDSASVHAQRADPLHRVNQLQALKPPEPFFAFIHLINPHPPYYETGPSCERREAPYLLRSPWGEPEDYWWAVQCLNRRLVPAIDLILEDDPNAIVILQGDHGPGHGINFSDGDPSGWTDSDLDLRLGVFSAMRLPAECPAPPRALSLVNTFRIVFSCIGTSEVPTLAARTWVADHYGQQFLKVEISK